MTNKELINEYITDGKNFNATNHLGYAGNTLFNYSTAICLIDRANRIAAVNARKYSTTTSKIQGTLRYELARNGYEIKDYDGEPCYYWNLGYQGAQGVTRKEMAEIYYAGKEV